MIFSRIQQLFILFLLLLFLPFSSSLAQEEREIFPDLDPSNPYFQDIIDLYERGLVEGYEDGTFRSKDLISRAEFVKLVLGVGQCVDCSNPPEELRSIYTERPFPDIAQESWYFYCVSHGKTLGIITGYLGEDQQGLYVPEDPISRAESVAILMRAAGIAPDNSDPMIVKDVISTAWYIGYVKKAVNMGLIEYRNGFVAPEEKIQRDEFAHLVNGVMQDRECTIIRSDLPDSDGDGVPDERDDCPTTAGELPNGCPAEDDGNENRNENLNGDIPDGTPPIDGGGEDEPDGNGNVNAPDDDGDGDGIPDDEDVCPDIPGDLNGAENVNGCPTFGDPLGYTTPGLFATKPACTTCPCPTLEYKADIREGDIVFGIISDETNQTIYSKSNLYYVTE